MSEPNQDTEVKAGATAAVVAGVLSAVVLVRMIGANWPDFDPTFPDSFSYLKVATHGPFSPAFWFGERPILYPLLLWAVARSSTLAVLVQTLLYIGAFLFLCSTALRVLRSKAVAYVTVVAFACVAVHPRFALWNTLLLSESLSLSLAVVSVAAWWRAAATRAPRWIWAAAISTGLWMLVRDGNAVVAIAVLTPVFLLAFLRKEPGPATRSFQGGVAMLLIVTAFVFAGQQASQRNRYPVHNNVGVRVLQDPEMTRFFVAGGMPLDDALRGRTGHFAWDDSEAFLRDPALERYREWAESRGQVWLLLSMAWKAPYWMTRFDAELPNIVRENSLEAYDGFKTRDRLPGALPFGIGGATTPAQLAAWTILGIAGATAAGFDRRRVAVAAFAWVACVSAALDIYLSYAGDAIEVNRHLVGPLARLTLISIIGIAIGADYLRDTRARTAKT